MLKHKFLLLLSLMFAMGTSMSYAQKGTIPPKKPAGRKATIYPYLPSGYQQLGDTRLYYLYTLNNPAAGSQYGSIDILGQYDDNYYSSTYEDSGYRVALQVGDNSARDVNCIDGTTIDGVTITAAIEQQTELARIVYSVSNGNPTDVNVSLGVHADVMIGRNDHAPIERRIDTEGKTYGLTMKDGNGAQMCVLFGAGLTGVTATDDFWFGYWSDNSDAYNMVGNYYTAGNWMQENGSYDSGMGWCWKNRTIPAGSTVQFSYIIGVGEVNFVPSSTFDVKPDLDFDNLADIEAWNDLSLPHTFTATGYYESPFGQDGYIEYAVEDSEEWTRIDHAIQSGTTFSEDYTVMFDPEREVHVIRFRITDFVGNMTSLPSVEIIDVRDYEVSGIVDKNYTGEEQIQSNLTYNFDITKTIIRYEDNVNAGTAKLIVEGLFPYTIGRKAYLFTIHPQPLEGGLNVTSCVYNGEATSPEFNFTVDRFNSLEKGVDYDISLSSVLPGASTLTVTGKGNYTGSLTTDIIIDKGVITPALYAITLPESPVEYDGLPHGASVVVLDGVGAATITYTIQGESDFTTDAPIEIGKYDIYLEIAGSDLYNGLDKTLVGEVEIVEKGSLPDNPDPTDIPDVTINTTSDNSNVIGEYNEQTVNATIEGLEMLPYKWNTICLPFDATLEQAKEALGEEVDIEELVRSTYNEETMLLTLYFTPRLSIQAGMPYVVKVASNITNPVFKGVTISNVDPITITTDYSSMTGNYNPTEMVAGDKNTLFISNNHFYYPSSTGPLPATKCWFTLLGAAQQGASDNGVKGVEISFDGDSSTAIYSITETVNTDDAYYTLQGIRVVNPTRGVYIHRGEKVIIK